jgi:hypothetical protein
LESRRKIMNDRREVCKGSMEGRRERERGEGGRERTSEREQMRREEARGGGEKRRGEEIYTFVVAIFSFSLVSPFSASISPSPLPPPPVSPLYQSFIAETTGLKGERGEAGGWCRREEVGGENRLLGNFEEGA